MTKDDFSDYGLRVDSTDPETIKHLIERIEQSFQAPKIVKAGQREFFAFNLERDEYGALWILITWLGQHSWQPLSVYTRRGIRDTEVVVYCFRKKLIITD